MRLSLALAVAATVGAASTFACAQEASPASPAPAMRPQESTVLEDVIVEARRMEDAVRAYVDTVGEPPRGARVARWNSDLCLSVSGMQRTHAQYLVDRISVRALDAGANVAGPGCRPNVIILATDDGPGLASRLVSEAGLGFRPSLGGTHLSRQALDNFRTSTAPVRWWHVAVPVDPASGTLATRFIGDDIPSVSSTDASRLRSTVRYDMAWAIIIIDTSRTNGVRFGALADYVALASLAQLDPSADTSEYDSILNLFSTDYDGEGELSSWDADYLKALYTSSTDRANPEAQQRSLIQQLIGNRTATSNSASQP